ncbi:Crp/Fnr family transcriptional regulator [Epibacterium ulvae]|uniref:Crp/Fnr family transcriptional regulator n=1 Tax=Epibacterium ulvae TaxID=1156985 RepID=UPI001BFC5645|nr:Crp/Fnr family transcriptional regulator [Epibacterium ulvae]MBT8152498.1 Crp/Fnr family transcriptional regulator [Epibacterium ulvae]
MSWLDSSALMRDMDDAARRRLAQLTPHNLPNDQVLFRPGDAVQGYVIVLEGCVDVGLSGVNGREMLLYSVTPGQSCIQSTLGLLGGDDYSAEARTRGATRLVLLPKSVFLELLNRSDSFRALVMRAFSDRMQMLMHLLEKVTFQRAEHRLAERLLELDHGGEITITQGDLAREIGTAREVVSRRLEAWAKRGWVETGRGRLRVLDRAALVAFSQNA